MIAKDNIHKKIEKLLILDELFFILMTYLNKYVVYRIK